MRRALAVAIGTLAIHGVLGVLLVLVDPPRADERPGSPLVLEVVEPTPIPVRPAPLTSGGGRGGSAAPRAHRAHRAAPRRGELVQGDELTTTIEPVAGLGEGRGLGAGHGEGGGQGGLADPIPPAAPVPPPPPAPGPPPISKARPPRLVYPSRQVEVDDDVLFIATLTIDAEGFVAGARLTHGFGGPRDDAAAAAVWRFRYAPALDDAGRPIRATLAQKFDLGR